MTTLSLATMLSKCWVYCLLLKNPSAPASTRVCKAQDVTLSLAALGRPSLLPVFPFPLSEPSDRPAVLLIGDSEQIAVTHLNGSLLQTFKSLNTKGMHTMDFSYSTESLCWVTVAPTARRAWCSRMRGLHVFSEEWEMRVGQNLQSESLNTLTQGLY